MADCEALLHHLVPSGGFSWQGQVIDLTSPWPRLTVAEAFRRHASCSIDQALTSGRFDEILTAEVEPNLGPGPIFLIDYPAPLAALARLKPGDPAVAERCELYLGGLELVITSYSIHYTKLYEKNHKSLFFTQPRSHMQPS